MSHKEPSEPLRGEAAYRAQRAEIAKNNDAAYARGRSRRAAKDAEAAQRRVADDRAERDRLPVQPEP